MTVSGPENDVIDHQVNPKRVLVVDDDPNTRKLLFAALRTQGFQPLVAEDGRGAQKLLERYKPGVILLDLMMPGMNGWDFLDWLRAIGLTNSTRVVIITAHSDPQADDLRGRGASEVLRKPFEMPALFSLLNKLSFELESVRGAASKQLTEDNTDRRNHHGS